MNSQTRKERELAKIVAVLEGNPCALYNYDEVLEILKQKQKTTNLSAQFELTAEEISVFLQVFSVEKFSPDHECGGCKYAALVKKVLMRRIQLENIVSSLYRTLSTGKFIS